MVRLFSRTVERVSLAEKKRRFGMQLSMVIPVELTLSVVLFTFVRKSP